MTKSPSRSSTHLRAQNISFRFGGKSVIQNVSINLEPGSLTALVGPNGAGKSTLLHLLDGRLRKTSGTVDCDCRMALMPQRAEIDWTFPITVAQMVKLGDLARRENTAPANADELLKRVGLQQMGQRRLNQLSGGQQQRVLLARSLMQQAGILLLDEPCSAIDPPTRNHLLQVMREQAQSGQTLLVSSHDWGSALDSYDQVVVLNGEILANGTPDDVRGKLTDMTCMMGSTCCG